MFFCYHLKMAADSEQPNDQEDFLDQMIRERTENNPDYPEMLERAENRRQDSNEDKSDFDPINNKSDRLKAYSEIAKDTDRAQAIRESVLYAAKHGLI
jgi:hypothetical protein